MNSDLPKNPAPNSSKGYDPAAVESQAYDVWLKENLFHAEPENPGDPYSIVIPPPNVTGALHLGHAINNTLQDILTRVHRMRGFNTVWIPGLDHAGIATQAVVERQLKENEGLDRHDIGREKLVERIWQWKAQFGDRIIEQLKRLGCSCDWDRTRFTLDEQCAKAVRETFFKLFKDGLIYRGKRLVNWDIHLQTSISDDEIYHETVKTSLWHIKYEIVDTLLLPLPPGEGRGEGVSKTKGTSSSTPPHPNPLPEGEGTQTIFMVVATTRPETLLGDTAVAVHSEDPRWNWAIGKHVKLPLTNRLIPIIADDILVDPKFGTGVVKVTPAHDPNDYAVYQRHLNQDDKIEILNILNPDGTLNENAGPYKGMKRDAARKKVVEDLGDLLLKEEPYETQVGHSDRSKTPVEPYLSDQWFVKMAPLAEPALEVVRNGTIKFFPERHAQQYLSWLGEKRDWPISRQLWWGHRIPVWSRTLGLEQAFKENFGARPKNALVVQHLERLRNWAQAGRIAIAGDTIEAAQQYRFICVRDEGDIEVLKELSNWSWFQDPDVLDTWFSSALWPHSTLGWPEKTADLAKWYPTSVLLTGRDIITLWVARMVMMGIYNMGETKPPLPPGEGRGEGVLENRNVSDSQHPLTPTLSRREREKEFGIPFFHVAINPTILDGRGERMSKSKGNGVDPVDIIETHGADALRFTLTSMATETQDVRMPVKKLPDGRNTSDKFDFGRNFCNKLWNAARFVLGALPPLPPGEGRGEGGLENQNASDSPYALTPTLSRGEREFSLADNWIISRFNRAIEESNAALGIYRFDQYAKICYDFFWRDFCDWYLEASKPALKDEKRAAQTATILAAVLDGSLRLMHPIIPFITETIWWQLNEVRPQRGVPGILECPPSARLIKAPWPTACGFAVDIEQTFAKLQEIIQAIRNARNDYKIDPKKSVDVSILTTDSQIESSRELIELLAICKIKQISGSTTPIIGAIRITAAGCEIFIEGLADADAEKQRSAKRRDELTKQIVAMKGRLGNEGYLAKAPQKLVEETKKQLAEAETELAKLT
jgi:valyl-tRNA synthetase